MVPGLLFNGDTVIRGCLHGTSGSETSPERREERGTSTLASAAHRKFGTVRSGGDRAGLRGGAFRGGDRGTSSDEPADGDQVAAAIRERASGRTVRCAAKRSAAPRSGQPRRHDDAKVQEILDATLNRRPKRATHWSVRSLSAELGMPRDFVHRVWRAFGLKPHLSHNFKLSTDPHFEEKVRDVVGLYLGPPDKALVLCVDEISQIQALDRTQRSLPMNYGTPETHTHEYRRYGTTTLFAALDVATGKVIGKIKRRHRSIDFISFLRHVDRVAPDDLDVHLILDNYGIHKTAEVKQWLLRQRRFHCHFTPILQFLAQSGGAFLRQSDGATVAAWQPPLRGGLGEGDPRLPGHPQRAAEAVPLDEIRRRDHRVGEQRT